MNKIHSTHKRINEIYVQLLPQHLTFVKTLVRFPTV